MATTDLIDLAVETSKNAYVPYSHFPIGAVLVAKIYANQKISEEMLTEFKKNVRIDVERKKVSEIIEVIS